MHKYLDMMRKCVVTLDIERYESFNETRCTLILVRFVDFYRFLFYIIFIYKFYRFLRFKNPTSLSESIKKTEYIL